MLRVLVAEDDVIVGVLLGEILDSFGHVVCAIEATETRLVRAASRYRPDLMIVDAHLGGGSGVRAVAEILRTGHVAHLFMSGGPVAAPPGAVILEKPFWDFDLQRAIELAMNRAASFSPTS